jgi:hypothetical protein
MQLFLRALTVLQTLAIEVAALAAMGEVDTIQYSGPMLSGVGLLIAYLSFRGNRPVGLCFGLGTPTASILCFSLICGFGWSPDDARRPMCFIVVAVAVFHVVAAFFALEELSTAQAVDRQKLPFQFSIMALLVLMLLVSVFFGSYQSFGQVVAALGALFVYAVIVAYLLRQFHVMRLRFREGDVRKGLSAFPQRRNDNDER